MLFWCLSARHFLLCKLLIVASRDFFNVLQKKKTFHSGANTSGTSVVIGSLVFLIFLFFAAENVYAFLRNTWVGHTYIYTFIHLHIFSLYLNHLVFVHLSCSAHNSLPVVLGNPMDFFFNWTVYSIPSRRFVLLCERYMLEWIEALVFANCEFNL